MVYNGNQPTWASSVGSASTSIGIQSFLVFIGIWSQIKIQLLPRSISISTNSVVSMLVSPHMLGPDVFPILGSDQTAES